MSANVGLSTPRGSGTSGYVQRNLSTLRPYQQRSQPYPDPSALRPHRQRQPDAQILKHERLREIEVKVFDLRDKLEDEGVEEEEIERRVEGLRRRLMGGGDRGEGDGDGDADERDDGEKDGGEDEVDDGEYSKERERASKRKGGGKQLKAHQVHELAEKKIEESERLRRALGIREDYEEGGHWKEREQRIRGGIIDREGQNRNREGR